MILHASTGNIFDKDLLFFPMCDKHEWALVVVHLKERRIQHYNDRCTNEVARIEKVLTYLMQMHWALLGCELPNLEIWQAHKLARTELAQVVANGSDCGLFTCRVAFDLLQGQALEVAPTTLTSLRQRLLQDTEVAISSQNGAMSNGGVNVLMCLLDEEEEREH